MGIGPEEEPVQSVQPIVIFCKSYASDLLRAKRLAQSIQRFNADHIPFYLSVPASDLGLFKEHFQDLNIHWLTDEQILAQASNDIGECRQGVAGIPGHLVQQIVKIEFWRLGCCRNYLVVDSDSYFIKPFAREDFLYDGDLPYTVMHEAKDLMQFAARHGMKKIQRDYVRLRRQFQSIFHRKGRLWDFGPTPLVWSAMVWEGFNRDWVVARKTHIIDTISRYPCEILLYGEYLLQSRIIPLFPAEPLFKVYHYREQYEESRRVGEDEKVLSQNFLGVVMQSNWDQSMGGASEKPRRLGRFWGSKSTSNRIPS